MKTLLCMLPIPGDSTSWYRAGGPLIPLAKKMNFELMFSSNPSWFEISLCDAVFMQRPSDEGNIDQLAMMKDYGKPIWVEYDDDLLNVTAENYAFDRFGSEKSKQIIKLLLSEADFITVSTGAIKDVYQPHTKSEIQIIPNAHNDYLYPPEKRRLFPRQASIVWRGGESHVEDLLSHKDIILDVAADNPEWKWIFMGYNPWFITKYLPKDSWAFIESQPIPKYYAYLNHFAPSLTICPLNDSPFNRAKSNCQWLESNWAGAETVSSQLPEWMVPGCFNMASFEAALRVAINQDFTKSPAELGWKYICENLLLSKINEQRATIIKKLLSL